MGPLVSVVIPYYNGDEFISEAVSSVVDQTYNNIEIIVVDDGSNQSSTQALNNISVDNINIVEHKENKGIASARNTGINLADGKYVSLLDQDDVWKKHRIEKMVSILESDDSIGLAISNYYTINSNGEITGSKNLNYDMINWSQEKFVKFMVYEHWKYNKTHLPLTSDFVRASVFDEVGLYNEELYGYNDQDFLLRTSKNYNIKLVKEKMMSKRMHETNAINNKEQIISDKMRFYKKVLSGFPKLEQYSSEILSHIHLKKAKVDFINKNFKSSMFNLGSSFYYSRRTPIEMSYKYLR